MNPSYNGTFGSGNAGGNARGSVFGAGGAGAGVAPQSGQSVQPAQPVPGQSGQPVPPAMAQQPVQPAQPVQPMQPIQSAQPMMARQPMMTQQPISSPATDEVVFRGGGEKRSYKKLIIAIILIVAILALGGIAVVKFLMPADGGGISFGSNTKSSFNKYANYLLYGEDSINALEGNYDENSGAKIFDILEMSSDTRKEYSDKLSELWNNFLKGTDNFTLKNGVTRDDYGERVAFIVTYFKNGEQAEHDRSVALARKDEEEAAQIMDDYFTLYNGFDFEDARNYVANGQLLYGSDVDNENDMMEYSAKVSSAIRNTMQYLVENVWEINEYLNGGGK